MQEAPNSSNSPLQRFVGAWRGEVTVEATGAAPEHYTQENNWAWTLGGLFLKDSGTGSNGSAFLGLWSLDTRSGKYRAHYFLAPSGDAVVLTHEWDAARQCFVGSADLGGGFQMLAEDHFLDRDTYEWSITIQDGTGQVLTRMHGRERRV
jgi:hypothetical protein